MSLEVDIEDIYPLSPMQQGMLFHSLYAPTSGLYVAQKYCALEGALDIDLLERAWQAVVSRHPALRTSFFWEEVDSPVQILHRKVSLKLERLDWRGLSSSEQEQRLNDFIQADQRMGFDLTSVPLMRLSSIRMADDIRTFIWSYHHLLLDAWCSSLILNEVFAFYEAFCRGRDLDLKSNRPYRDYIAWLQRQDLTKAETYWRERLKGFSAPVHLSVEKMTGDTSGRYEAGEQKLSLTRAATEALQWLGRKHHLTLNTIVQGAWAILLSHYSGEDDIVFGAVVSGRPPELKGVESMIGLLINTLPVRVFVDSQAPLIPWLTRLQNQQVEARQYEYSPLAEVQVWSEVPNGVPLFDIIFVFENYPDAPSLTVQGGGLKMRDVRSNSRMNYPLSLTAATMPELLLRIGYECRRFDDATISRMLGHLSALLGAMADNPDRRICMLSLLTEAERQQVMAESESAGKQYSRGDLIHKIFEHQVESNPNAMAVVYGEEHLTYGELNRRANQLAHHLLKLGVRPDEPVGICMQRCAGMIVGLLGILKSGGAYLPLDMAHPQARLSYILQDAEAAVLITQKELLEQLPDHEAHITCLDSDWHAIESESPENPNVDLLPGNTAYVIYTSGSTGKPKGVLISHRNVTRLFEATHEMFRFNEDDIWTMFHSYAFDFSVWELWGGLLNGGKVVVVPYLISRSPEAFYDLLREERVTVLNQTPSAFRQIMQVEESSPGTNEFMLRLVIFGGEALELQSLKPWFERHGERVQLVNMYGITETTVHVTFRPIKMADLTIAANSPIGRPITDLEIYLLNKHQQLLPVGVPGEIYVGGEGVAVGYLGRPDLTAERFVPNPFAKKEGARLYKSGDLARRQPDSELEYLGRGDHQVKIRGFRIELGEIESVLNQHPSVKESLVLLNKDAAGDRKLIAYLAVREPKPSTIQMRSYLLEHLPEYMAASTFIMMEAFPLTPNGKVDRRALEAADNTGLKLEEDFIAPRTAIEEVMAGIWAELLGIPKVGAQDDFFQSGGHSLLATQAVLRMRAAFQVELSIQSIFETPTLGALSEIVEAELRSGRKLQVSPIERVSRDGPLPLSFAQQRLWFLDQMEPGNAFYNIPGALRLEGNLNAVALEKTINEIIRRHEILRTRIEVVNGEPMQVVEQHSWQVIAQADLTQMSGESKQREAERVMRQEARREFDLSKGGLIRSMLIKLAEEEDVLVVVMHHIVSDAWSVGVFMKEVCALYESYSKGEQGGLAEMEAQYADYAVWQKEWLKGEVLEEQVSYWTQKLGGRIPVLNLPTDRPRPPVQSYRGAQQFRVLPDDLSSALSAMSRQEGVTLFMIFLAAFQTLLHRYTMLDDISVGSPIAGRTRIETEGLIGFFVNTLVLRTDLSGEPTFREVLQRVRRVTIEAQAHQYLPFEKLVEILQPTRKLDRTPLLQVYFAFKNASRESFALPGLKLRSVKVDTGTVKLDLGLSVLDDPMGLIVSAFYCIDLFNDDTITVMLDHFEALLKAVAENPDQKILDVPLARAGDGRESRKAVYFQKADDAGSQFAF